jgi:hypothetical protein
MSGEKNRHFGNIRKLASGRYQARYRGPDGRLHAAPHTFERKSEASRIFTTAVEEDRIVRRNPCRIEGAGRKSRTSGKSCPCP